MASKVIKRLMAVVLSAGMIMSFTGCLNNGSKDSEKDTQNQQESSDEAGNADSGNDDEDTDSGKDDADNDATEETTTKAELTIYDHEVPYVNKEGLENGDYTILLRRLGETEFDKCVMVTYKAEDRNVNSLLSQKSDTEYSDICFYEIVDDSYSGLDAVNETYIVDTIDDYLNRVTIEYTTALSYESAEEYAEKKDDAKEAYEKYYVGDYYVVVHKDSSTYCNAYKFIDKDNIVVMTSFFEEGDDYKKFFDAMLERITIEAVEGTSAVTGADKGYAMDRLAKILAEKYPVYFRDYRYIKEFDDYEIVYETENCEYKLKADSDSCFEDDLEKGRYVLYLEYEEGVGLYTTDSENKYAVVNTNTGCIVDIRMDTDVEGVDEQIDLLRKELLK